MKSTSHNNSQQHCRKRRKIYKQKNKISKDNQQNQPTQGGGTNEQFHKVNFPYNISQGENLSQKFPYMDDVHHFLTSLVTSQYPAILIHPFPAQPQQKLVPRDLKPLTTCNGMAQFHPTTTNAPILMCQEEVNVTM